MVGAPFIIRGRLNMQNSGAATGGVERCNIRPTSFDHVVYVVDVDRHIEVEEG